jgi:Peptidase family M28
VSEPQRIDLLGELDDLLKVGRRAPGSDAERRAAVHLRDRLSALGRDAEAEPVDAYPNWPLAYAILAAATVAASVLAVYVPLAGAAVALAAALLTFLDAALLVPTLRRPLGRRASQNVISKGPHEGAGALVLVAHTDAGRGGVVHSDRNARRWAALGRLVRRPIGGLQPLFWAELGVLACALIRLTGLDGTVLTIAQFVPTLALLVAIALLIDVALSPTRGGENDNASGCVVVLRLAQRFGSADALQHFNLHVLFTGAQHAGTAGMRAFLKRHELPRAHTVFLNVDRVGSGEVRYTRREGALFTQRSHPQLTALCEQIVEDELDAAPLTSRSASDASAAAAKGYAAVGVTCRDDGDYASGRVDERALERAEAFCAELIERIDAELGPSLAAPVEETALSEPQ